MNTENNRSRNNMHYNECNQKCHCNSCDCNPHHNNAYNYSNTCYCNSNYCGQYGHNNYCCRPCCYIPIPGPQGPQGPEGPQGPQGEEGKPGKPGEPCDCKISQPCATFIVSSDNVEGATVPYGGNVKGWTPPIGTVNSPSISVDSDGVFTIGEAGVYYINSYVSILRGTGYENQSETRLDYSFAISSVTPSPTLPSTVFTGLSTSTTSGGILAGTLVAYLPAGFKFRVENTSNVDISIINGASSGTSASISIFRFADSQKL